MTETPPLKSFKAERTKYLGPSNKSSFQNLWKYGSKRRTTFSTTMAWLAAKKRDDGIDPHLWRVHDKLYDLKSFINSHPGGSEWLTLSQGMDITELFENSHVVNVSRVEKTLEKFYVKDADKPRNSPYTFEPNGFYKTLKRRIEPVLKQKGTNPTLSAKLFQDGIVLCSLILTILAVREHSYGLIALAGVALGINVASAHNFLHIKENWRRYYFDLSVNSHFEWRVQHVFSHHGFPNTVLDAEVTTFAPIFEFLPSRRKTWFQRYGPWVYSHLAYFLSIPWQFFVRIWCIVKGRHPPRWEHFLPIVELLLFIWFCPSIKTAFHFWLLLQGMSSYWVLLTGLNAAHHHPVCFHDGDEARVNPDYGLCMLDATCSKIEDDDRSLFTILSTFGEHNLHHLFPTVCISKIGHIKKIVEDTVKEFEEDLIRLSQWQLFTGLHEQLARVKPNPLPKKRS